MNTYPPDMKPVELIADDDLVSEYMRRVVARNGSIVVVEVQDIQGDANKQYPRMRWGGQIFACMGLNRWAGTIIAKTAITGKSP